MNEKIHSIREENTRLRAALAHSSHACVYCQLPAAEWSKCRSGFPGCSRADDMSGCPEFGAMMNLYEVQKELTQMQFHAARFLNAYAFLSGQTYEEAARYAPEIIETDVPTIIAKLKSLPLI